MTLRGRASLEQHLPGWFGEQGQISSKLASMFAEQGKKGSNLHGWFGEQGKFSSTFAGMASRAGQVLMNIELTDEQGRGVDQNFERCEEFA